ncbi:hypothetical protein F66182_3155 [Fusarium sp. NRRL 66182]|nr:hypothetical protein F66182_3155 [Fusarium sp. NRRL 66182]
MALKKRKRRQEATLCHEHLSQGPPAKKLKSTNDSRTNARDYWEYPPEFWDRLSKIELTHRALEEHDRRIKHSSTCSFALTSESGGSRSANPPSTQPASASDKSNKSNKSNKSTAYSRNFDQHLTDNNVEPLYSSEEPDLDGILSTLAQPRPSLSPSKFSDGAFKAFRQNNAIAEDEDDVLANVMPAILGPSTTAHPSGRNTAFGNLEPLTDGTIAPAKPDIYYGSLPEQLSKSVRDRIGQHIIPSSMHDKPLAPNFFVQVKGPDGSAAIATRQARYDGAVGSRAMHSLQNYGREQLQYDGQANTFSTTYHNGQLQIYAHHTTAPINGQGQPRYHMTQVDALAMTGNRDGFIRGATAFRNARDLAKQRRDGFIQAANSRVPATVSNGDFAALDENAEDEDESTDEFVDCEEPGPLRTPREGSLEATGLDDDTRAPLRLEPNDAVASFASSFTSGLTTNNAKRQRQPLSPSSKSATRSPPSKLGRRRETDRHVQKTSSANQPPADKN